MSEPHAIPLIDHAFDSVPIRLVAVDLIHIPADRQRKNAQSDNTLRSSIQDIGLLNPIILRTAEDGTITLIAGERRLHAFSELGKTHIPARFREDMNGSQHYLAELHENFARRQLTWQETCESVATWHNMQIAAFAGWTRLGTANALGYSASWVSEQLMVAAALDDPDVRGSATFIGARNLIENRAQRTLAAAKARGITLSAGVMDALRVVAPNPETATDDLLADIATGSVTNTAATPTSRRENIMAAAREAAERLEEQAEIAISTQADDDIICADFLKWAEAYTGPLFNVIHCDFPYGKDFEGSRQIRSQVRATPIYDDSAETFFNLLEGFIAHQDKFVAPEAHMIFWFDMGYYQVIIDRFKEAGWHLAQPYPLLWHKGSSGNAADPKRRPRHCYETAFLFSRGDRHIVKLVLDHIGSPVDDVKLHLSQKPIHVLSHFLSMVIDKWARVLDPTCGSATSIAAAKQLGAEAVLGIELDPSNYEIARYTAGAVLPLIEKA